MNEKAQGAFISKVQTANDLLLSIMNHMDNHMDVDPESVNYGHVGSVAHVVEQLEEIKSFLNI